MSGILFSKNIQAFFTELRDEFSSFEDFGKAANRAVMCIADDLHIGCVKYILDSPSSLLKSESFSNEHIIFKNSSERISEKYICKSYSNGDGGTLDLYIYTVKDVDWTTDELDVLEMISHEIYTAGSRMVTNKLLKSAITTNLLMNIPNQTGYMSFINDAISNGNITKYDAFYFNIRNFKYVNTVLPFSQENDILKIYGQILSNSIDKDEIVAHLGSDNFCALILKEHSSAFLNMIQNFSFEYIYDGERYIFSFGATVGAAHMTGHMSPGQVMMNINSAYLMARQHRYSIEYYSEKLLSDVMMQKEIFAKFKPAIQNEDFVIYYQPKVRVSDRKICGAEALVRWHEGDTLISPMNFIPTLEKDGSICELDFYVLEKVCQFIRRHLDSGLDPIRISTNFSRNHLHNPTLAKDIEHMLDKYNIPHDLLEVELTESEDFRDYKIMEEVVESLRETGISTSIDDFGTGYSSLNMLKRTQLDLIKIDKSFIPDEHDYPDKEKDYVMFKQIVDIAKSLGMETIAEGVETDGQYEYLKNVKCDMVPSNT